jgi:hypothetical protein
MHPEWATYLRVLLALHIACGVVAFLCAPVGLARQPRAAKCIGDGFGHMQGMIGSYIAAMTAFSAVNLSRWFGAAWWVWLWPTIVGVPVIATWTAYYKKRFLPKTETKIVVA